MSNAPESPLAATVNPAQAALIGRYEIQTEVAPYEYIQNRMDFPGTSPVVSSTQGPSFRSVMAGMPLPGNCGLSLMGIPPKVIKANKKLVIPIFILNQLNQVAVSADADFKGLISLAGGCRIGHAWAVGVSGLYQGYSYQASVSTESDKTEIVRATGEDTKETLSIGIRYAHNRHLLLSGKVEIWMAKNKKQIIAATNIPNGAFDTSSANKSWFGKFRGGVGLRSPTLGSLYLESEYVPLRERGQTFSYAEFRKKTEDEYSTVSLHLGYKMPVGSSQSLLAGLEYVPASLGAGGRGPGTMAGYSAVDAGQANVGVATLRPRWITGLGLEMEFGKAAAGASLKKEATASTSQPIHWIVRTGLTYDRAHFSTGDNGEQPAVYTEQRFSIPLEIQAKF